MLCYATQAQVERRILAAVTHPFVVELHAAIQTHDRLLFVLQLCPGGDLSQHLKRRAGRPFPPSVAAFVGAQVLLALEYLHGLQIVHRDLKLENVLVDAEGYCRLTDFNVAKLLEGGRTFSTGGTTFAMAPEVITNAGHGPAADFWGFGVMLYELLTAGLPFYCSDNPDPVQNRRETLQMILRCPVRVPKWLPVECQLLINPPQGLQPRGLLEKNQTTRLQDPAEIKRHSFFRELHPVDQLLRKQILSPLRESVQQLVAVADRAPPYVHTPSGGFPAAPPLAASDAITPGWDWAA